MLPAGIVGARVGKLVALQPFELDGSAYGGLIGPVGDATQLVALHANRGSVGGHRFLAADTIDADRHHDPRAPLRPDQVRGEIQLPLGVEDVGAAEFGPGPARPTVGAGNSRLVDQLYSAAGRTWSAMTRTMVARTSLSLCLSATWTIGHRGPRGWHWTTRCADDSKCSTFGYLELLTGSVSCRRVALQCRMFRCGSTLDRG